MTGLTENAEANYQHAVKEAARTGTPYVPFDAGEIDHYEVDRPLPFPTVDEKKLPRDWKRVGVVRPAKDMHVFRDSLRNWYNEGDVIGFAFFGARGTLLGVFERREG